MVPLTRDFKAEVSAVMPDAPPATGSEFWLRADGWLQAQVYRSATTHRYPAHIHPEYTLTVCLNGSVWKREGGQEQRIGSGGAVISSAGSAHASAYLAGSRGCLAVSVSFDPALLPEFFGRTGDLPRGVALLFPGEVYSAVLRQCALEVAAEMKSREHGYPLAMESLAIRMLVEAARQWRAHPLETIATEDRARLSRRDFVRAHALMRQLRKDQFRVGRICRELGLSEERFLRLFRAAVNDSPANYYNRLLLEEGRDLLGRGNLSVKEVSHRLGYKTSSHFIAAYRNQYGVTPSAHRRGPERAGPAGPAWCLAAAAAAGQD